jgi:hypothetical protein
MLGRIYRDLLSGVIGTALAAIGFFAAFSIRQSRLFLWYLVAIGAFFVIVAEGQIDAPYRQLRIVPALSFLVALGAVVLFVAGVAAVRLTLAKYRSFAPRPAIALAVACLFVAASTWAGLTALFRQDPAEAAHPGQWELSQVIKRHAHGGTKLVTAGEYTIHRGGNDLSPVIYHYTGLRGWSLQRGDWSLAKVEGLVAKGATLFMAWQMEREPDSAPFLDAMKRRYRLLHEAPGELLLALR